METSLRLCAFVTECSDSLRGTGAAPRACVDARLVLDFLRRRAILFSMDVVEKEVMQGEVAPSVRASTAVKQIS